MKLSSKLPRVGTTIFTVMSRLAAEHGAVDLGQGFPDFDPPSRLREALAEAVRKGANQYAPMSGLPALREAIAGKTQAMYGFRPDPETGVTVTSGATQALFSAIQAVVRAGDEVVVLDPAYDSYEPAVELAGGTTVHVPLDSTTFAPDWDRVGDAVTSRTRLLVINSPHNPSGAVLGTADLQALAEILRETEVLLLSDEVYEHMVFDGERHESVLRHPELRARSLVVSSFGKTYHCTGWKTGYCVAPEALTTEFRKVHQYTTFCTFAPAQHAFAAMLAEAPEHHLELPAFYQAKRDHFRSRLAKTRLGLLPVPGGYFQLVDYSQVSDLDDAGFCRWLTTEKGVAAIPLSPFYRDPPPGQRLARLCFAKEEATLDAAILRLQAL